MDNQYKDFNFNSWKPSQEEIKEGRKQFSASTDKSLLENAAQITANTMLLKHFLETLGDMKVSEMVKIFESIVGLCTSEIIKRSIKKSGRLN